MLELPFNQSDVAAQFGSRDFSRGQTYWRRGAVKKLQLRQEGDYFILTAEVQGTRPMPYRVVITTRAIPTQKGVVIEPTCSCPVGWECKHAAATCLAALAAEDSTFGPQVHDANLVAQMVASLRQPQPSVSQPKIDPVEQWLESLAQAEIIAPVPQRPHESILYIFDVKEENWPVPSRQLVIRLKIAGLLKDGSYGAGRYTAVNHLNQSTARYITAEDKFIIKLMQGVSYSYSDDIRLHPGLPEISDLILRRMIETKRAFLSKPVGEPLSLDEARPARLGWQLDSDGVQRPALVLNDESMPVILPAARPWYVDEATRLAGPLDIDVAPQLVQKYLAGPKLVPNAIAGVAEKMAALLPGKNIAPPRRITVFKRDAMLPVPVLHLTSRKDIITGFADYFAELRFDYDGKVVDVTGGPDTLRWTSQDQMTVRPRHLVAEAEFIRRLTIVGEMTIFEYSFSRKPMAYGFVGNNDKRLRWLAFVSVDVPQLQAEGWKISIDPDFASDFATIEADDGNEAWQADLREQQGGNWWFSLDLGIVVEGERVALLPLLVQALKRLKEPSTDAIEALALGGKLYVDLPDGRALALPMVRVRDIMLTLVELFDQPLNSDGSMSVPLDLASALTRIDAATKLRWLGGERLRALLERLKSFSGLVEILPPQGLQASLRPYQREGLNWLQFLRDYGLGGILADDMGLGKTIQALAHVLIEKETGRMNGPCLIVCPTSLVPNWQDEAAKFAPSLKVLSLHGKDRATRFDEIVSADIVLTTYPLLPRDAERLKPVDWYMIVLDEAQVIKNPAAKITQLVCELKTQHRLCLTGTPIENHIGEAWSHFAFLMPGMLGSHKDFTKRFRVPIEKHGDVERQKLLARRLKPFILRRNKTEVAKELPPKTDIIHHVEFESGQRDLYETLRLTMHEKVQEAVSQKGFNRSRIVILDALLKLRQVCCDPRPVKLPSAKKIGQSAKLDALMQMLPEMIEGGRRILLFSQFTSMLDLIKPELDKAKIRFVEIRGDTVDRKTPVTQFQAGEVPLFLISLKAGGTGLNLTAADTVIHYDPWWNPAVENQATDRAHRIGQDKPVFVYKFIARGTIEERIIELQDRKRGLASALMDERAETSVAFEANDLEFLFEKAA